MSRVIVAVGLVLFWVASSFAVTRYVSTSGSDSNSCATSTSGGSSAKRNLNGASGAIACMASGDTLLVQNGTYNEQIADFDDEHHPNTTRPPNGTSWSNLTTIRAENYRGATINKPAAGGPYERTLMLALVGTEYISIEDLVIDARGTNTCVWIGPANHIQLKGNRIQNCGRNGIFVSVDNDDLNGDDERIIENEILNTAQEETPGVGSGTHCLYHTGKNSLIQGNYIHDCPFNGIQASSEHGGLFNNIFENNHITDVGLAGILSQGNSSLIRNNLLERNNIGLQCNGASGQKWYNNTVFGWWDSPANGNESYGILDLTSGCDWRNNLLLQQRDVDSVRRYIYYLNSPTLQNNMCDGVEAQNCQVNIADYTTVVIDGPGGNLQLVSTGAAVDAGVTLNSDVPLDRLGVSRPQGGSYDIGAYEFASGGDSTPPAVSITAPAASATVSGASVSVTATAADNVGVVGVQFKLDGSNLGAEDTTSTYGITWDTTGTSNGSHTLTAVARDATGNTTTSAGITVTVSNGETTPPTVSITAPAASATVSGASVSVTATASDNVGVVGVQFRLDGSNLGAEDTSSPYAITWDSTTASNGSHTLTAVARDAASNTTTSSGVSVTVSNVDAVFPTVSVTAPLTGATVSGRIPMSAIAGDNVGVVDVQFEVDGSNVDSPDVGPSYDRHWDTAGYSDGVHTVTAVARDAAGNTTTSAGVVVTVNNIPGVDAVVSARRMMLMSYLSCVSSFLGCQDGLNCVSDGDVAPRIE